MAIRILSLDGGGTWAILQAIALKHIYKDTGVGTKCRDILEQFDVIAANSGGSLMLAAMIKASFEDGDIDDVIALFLREQTRKSIFRRYGWGEKLFTRLFTKLLGAGPRYKTEGKLDGIRAAIGACADIPMCELHQKIKPHLVICSFDYDQNRAVFFKSNQDDKCYTLAEAVDAACNAPVNFFDEPVTLRYDKNRRHRFWDGGVGGNNNPVLVGITEALIIYPSTPRSDQDILVLSLGTGNNLLPLNNPEQRCPTDHQKLLQNLETSTFSRDVKKLSMAIISEPPEAANFIAHMLLGGSSSTNPSPHPGPCLVRMNPLLQPVLNDGRWCFPAAFSAMEKKTFLNLLDLDMDALEDREIKMIKALGHWWVNDRVVNQSIRYDSQTLRCEIGHDRFSAARADWLERCGLTERPNN